MKKANRDLRVAAREMRRTVLVHIWEGYDANNFYRDYSRMIRSYAPPWHPAGHNARQYAKLVPDATFYGRSWKSKTK